MARKHRKSPRPGHPDFVPSTNPERRSHADALVQTHAGHQCVQRADALCEAADLYAMVGDHSLAEQHFHAALDIADAEPGSVHGSYAAFLFDRGRDAEALDLITQARKLNPVEPEVFEIIGDALFRHDHPQQAARWFTTGLVRQLGSLANIDIYAFLDDFDLAILAMGRFRARQALGLAPDHIDDLIQQIQESRPVSDSIHEQAHRRYSADVKAE